MANRTFKVYGMAYAASGDVSVTMTVGGTQVFSGAVNDSSTPCDGEPTANNHLWTYTMDEATTGNLAVSIAVSGGHLCLGTTQHNLAQKNIVPESWVTANQGAGLTADNQTHLATEIGETLLDAEQAGLHAKLVAGTATNDDLTDIFNANKKGVGDADTYEQINDIRTNLAIDGATDALAVVMASTDVDKANWWIHVEDGETLTFDWAFDPFDDAITSS